MTAPYQTEAPSSTITSPTSVAVGAMNAVECTDGLRPSNEKSGINPPGSQKRAGGPQGEAGTVAVRDHVGRIGRGKTLHEHAAELPGRTLDAIRCVLGAERPRRTRR